MKNFNELLNLLMQKKTAIAVETVRGIFSNRPLTVIDYGDDFVALQESPPPSGEPPFVFYVQRSSIVGICLDKREVV